jgi:enamine deaminase RidA (YjgF/YER057c/UK114 family)
MSKHSGTVEARLRQLNITLPSVNSAAGFEQQFAVIDGASDLFVEVWGPEFGQHARSAVGMYELPRRITVEVEGVFELH